MKPTRDITNLRGNDLFAALTSGNAFKIKAPSKPVQQAHLANPIIDPWQDTALVLLINIAECSQCNSRWPSPNPILFIKRVHTRTGTTHLHSLQDVTNTLFRCSTLPRIVEHHVQLTSVCPHCFEETPLAEIDNSQRPPSKPSSVLPERINTIAAAVQKVQL